MNTAVLDRDYNYSFMKLQFELLGFSLEQIACEHEFPIAFLEDRAKTEKWVKGTTPLLSDDPDSIEDTAAALLQQKQHKLHPLYVKLEVAILTKAIQIADAIKYMEPTAANQLKAVAGSLETLLKQNPMLNQDTKEPTSGTNVRVSILGHVDADGSQTTGAQVVIENA